MGRKKEEEITGPILYATAYTRKQSIKFHEWHTVSVTQLKHHREVQMSGDKTFTFG